MELEGYMSIPKTRPKIGDYLLGKDKNIYRIIDTQIDKSAILYTIKGLNSQDYWTYDAYGHQYSHKLYPEIRLLTIPQLNKIGSIISEDKVNDILKVLYKR